MSNFERQMKRASQKQELDIVQHTVQALHAENIQLEMENKSLFRAMGAMVAVSGGELRIPRDLEETLKGKKLVTDVDGDELVFRTLDEGTEEEEKEVATN